MTEDLSGIRFPDDGYEEEPADGKGIYQISQVFRKSPCDNSGRNGYDVLQSGQRSG